MSSKTCSCQKRLIHVQRKVCISKRTHLREENSILWIVTSRPKKHIHVKRDKYMSKKRVSSEKDLSIWKRHSTNTIRKKNDKHSAIHVRKKQLHVIRDLQVWRECHDARVTSRRRLRGAPECVVRGWVEGRRIVVCEIYTCVYKYMYVYACLYVFVYVCVWMSMYSAWCVRSANGSVCEICRFVNLCMCKDLYTHIRVYICIYIYEIYIHTHTYIYTYLYVIYVYK